MKSFSINVFAKDKPVHEAKVSANNKTTKRVAIVIDKSVNKNVMQRG